MTKEIKEYIQKIIEVGANIQEGDSLIIYMPEETPEIKDIILELKAEYKIEDIIFIKQNYEKLYNLLSKDPTSEEISKHIETHPTLKSTKNVKTINFDPLTEHCPYYTKLILEFFAEFRKYGKINREKNKEFFNQLPNQPSVLTICPSKTWALELFNDENKTDKLWSLIAKTVPSIEELKAINKRRQGITEYLNTLKINSLHFYTSKGTDLNIKLTKYSKWITNPSNNNGSVYFTNFPSYEIFTAPNCLSAEGKIILTKPSFLYGGYRVNEAELVFSKGAVISCISDNQKWNDVINYKPNKLYRIGEIALVPHYNPISSLNQTFNHTILDENTDCHIALGNSFLDNITIPPEQLEQKGKQYYRFNNSKYHQDLTIGDETMCVEANVRGKTKTLIKYGNWQI